MFSLGKKVSRLLRVWFFFLVMALAWQALDPPPAVSVPVSPEVWVAPVKGNVDPGMYNFLRRFFSEAESKNIDSVLLEMDTPGGFLQSAWDIRSLIDGFPGSVYVYVRPHAISAGAFLALAADELYMHPGGTMGAAAPRQLGGGPVDEKTVSAWDNEMRGLAERNGRDPQIASAMVRPEVVVEGLVKEGELLTLTDRKALEFGYSEGTAASRGELLSLLGLEEARIKEFAPTPIDTLISWLTNPVIATLLLFLGIGGLIMELQTVGFGVAGVISLVSFGLYFSGHILGGLAGYEVLILFILGVVLMTVEALIPGFGIFGVAGLVSTVLSIVLAAPTTGSGLLTLAIALILAVVVAVLLLRSIGTKRGILRNLVLDLSEKKELGYVAPADQQDLHGETGIAITPLRPAGSVEIGDRRVDVVSEGGFISAGSRVTVVKVEGGRVIVRLKKE